MKARCFQYASLLIVATLAGIGLPAMAQSPDPVGATGNQSKALTARNVDLAAQAYDISGYLALSTVSSVIVQNPGQGSSKNPHKKGHGPWNAPEGGSPLVYLLLGALSCCGGLILSRRRRRSPGVRA